MFNHSLKKEALKIHENTLERYNKSYETMQNACESLYVSREDAVKLIYSIEKVINSIANTPKEFDTTLGQTGEELRKFKETKDYAQQAYEESVKAGKNIIGGVATGLGIATMAPTALMSIATTFGAATTGTAISALSGAAAQKAAVAWIGRTFAGFAVKGGAGMAAGQAFLALAGPIGWGLTAVSTGVSLISLSNKNKKIADDAVDEAKEISMAREALDEITEKVNDLNKKTKKLYNDMDNQRTRINSFSGKDYTSLSENDQFFLGTLVNNTLSLAILLNETIS